MMMKIFAYGSLMNQQDLRRTVPDAVNLTPSITHGYRRIFDLESTYRFDPITNLPICVLNLEPAHTSTYVNGVCFDMTEASFEELLEREKAYELITVDAFHYFKDEQYQAKCFISSGHERYPYSISSDLQLEYLRICAEGCGYFGNNFLNEFKKTTFFNGIRQEQYDKIIWSKLKSLMP